MPAPITKVPKVKTRHGLGQTVRRRNLERFYHIGPDGSRNYYSSIDNTLIRSAIAFEEPSVAIEDVVLPSGEAMQFEVRVATSEILCCCRAGSCLRRRETSRCHRGLVGF